MKSNLVDLELQLHFETPKAIKVSTDGDKDKTVWVPKSACEIVRKPRGIIIVTMPESLAIDKGLV